MKKQKLGEIYNIVKRPTINDIQFPNMRYRANYNGSKCQTKNKKQVEKSPIQTSIDFNQLKRTYSVNALTFRKDLKLVLSSPRKIIPDPESKFASIKNKLAKNQMLLLGQSPNQKFNFQNHNRRFTLLDLKIDIKKDFTQFQEVQNKKVPLETMFPGIKLSNTEINQQESPILRSSSSGVVQNQFFSQQGQSMRQTKRKPLFNGKILSIRRQKQKYPQELVLRKLVWDGRESKKIDHQLIYKEMIDKIKPQKTQQIHLFELKNEPIKDEMLLTAWEDNEYFKNKRQMIRTRQR